MDCEAEDVGRLTGDFRRLGSGICRGTCMGIGILAGIMGIEDDGTAEGSGSGATDCASAGVPADCTSDVSTK